MPGCPVRGFSGAGKLLGCLGACGWWPCCGYPLIRSMDCRQFVPGKVTQCTEFEAVACCNRRP